MSRISGYFLVASKPGGFTIQPCTLSPSLDVYQISSVCASSLPANTSSFTDVSCVKMEISRHEMRAAAVGIHHVQLGFRPRRVIDGVGGHEGDQLAVGRVLRPA